MPSTIYSPLPEGAILAGHDQDQTPMYIGRAWHEGDQLPAKVLPSKRACYVCHGGNEILKENYDVLCHGNITWVRSYPTTRSVPPFAVAGGQCSNGEPLYIGIINIMTNYVIGSTFIKLILMLSFNFRPGSSSRQLDGWKSANLAWRIIHSICRR